MTDNLRAAAQRAVAAAVGPMTPSEASEPIAALAAAIASLSVSVETCFEVRDTLPDLEARRQVSKAVVLLLRAHTHLALAATVTRRSST